MNLAHWLVRTARRTPEAPALLRGSTVVSDYAGFAGRAARLGNAFATRFGVRKGDRIALFMSNCTDYLEILYGAWFVGACVVPINYKLHEKEAAFIIADSAARLVLVDSHGEALKQLVGPGVDVIEIGGGAYSALFEHEPLSAPAPLGPDELAWLFYTSGTTGKPKGVMLTAANIHAMTYAYFIDVDEVRPSDAVLYAAPMSHGAGLYNFMHVLRGARHLVPASGGFDPAEIGELGRAVGELSFFAAPTMVRRMIDHAMRSGYRGEGIRTIVYGGGPMYVADIEQAVELFGPRFVQIYGQGESPMTITAMSREAVADRSHANWRERLGSVGLAQSCVEVIVADEEGKERPPGQTGEILVRGASVMAGYWNNPQATGRTLRDGWLWTGDMGSLDADGYLTLKDRSKDVIISGGTNIYPREVEEALLTHPLVHEVSVVGAPDPEWGETVTAFVVLAAEEPSAETVLDAHCRSQIARFKRPKRYVFLTELPKNSYGKVLKTELRTLNAESGA